MNKMSAQNQEHSPNNGTDQNHKNDKPTWSEWAKTQYDAQYENWVPWLEDLYLRYFTKDNKASYATKGQPSPTLHLSPCFLFPFHSFLTSSASSLSLSPFPLPFALLHFPSPTPYFALCPPATIPSCPKGHISLNRSHKLTPSLAQKTHSPKQKSQTSSKSTPSKTACTTSSPDKSDKEAWHNPLEISFRRKE